MKIIVKIYVPYKTKEIDDYERRKKKKDTQ